MHYAQRFDSTHTIWAALASCWSTCLEQIKRALQTLYSHNLQVNGFETFGRKKSEAKFSSAENTHPTDTILGRAPQKAK